MNKNLKILVTGVKGQLGFDCVRELKTRGYTNIIETDIDELDITNQQAVNNFFEIHKPDIVMHNAAWTAVDKAEEVPDLVYKVNALGPKYLAEAANRAGAKMVYISTDYVFEGTGTRFYETNDPKKGLSVYGKTKSQGEDFVKAALDKYFIVRITWAFGINGNNFVKTMLKLADMGKDTISVVNDQVGSPTYTKDLARLLCDMIETEKYGIYHGVNNGTCSCAELAEYIFEVAKTGTKVIKVTTEEYLKMVPNQARRPLNSRLSTISIEKAGFEPMPMWKDAVKRYIVEELGR